MNRTALFTLSLVLLCSSAAADQKSTDARRFTDKFDVPACTWSSTGRNDFFILEPGYQLIFDGHDGKDAVHLEVTVLDQTRKVAGVDTGIVEEKESRNGKVVEVSRNFFAVCRPTNDVFYFGEDVDMYKDGKVTSHEGSWLAGSNARAGLFMPARPLLGSRFYQEIAPGVALDRVEIISDAEALNTSAGTFRDLVKAEETTPLEPGKKDYKVYARGIGLVQDGELVISKYGANVTKGR